MGLLHLHSYLSDTQSDDSGSDLEASNMDKGYKLIILLANCDEIFVCVNDGSVKVDN